MDTPNPAVRRLSIVRTLGCALEDTHVELRAVDGSGGPVIVTVPVGAAMRLLNDLAQLAREGEWFSAEPRPE